MHTFVICIRDEWLELGNREEDIFIFELLIDGNAKNRIKNGGEKWGEAGERLPVGSNFVLQFVKCLHVLIIELQFCFEVNQSIKTRSSIYRWQLHWWGGMWCPGICVLSDVLESWFMNTECRRQTYDVNSWVIFLSENLETLKWVKKGWLPMKGALEGRVKRDIGMYYGVNITHDE